MIREFSINPKPENNKARIFTAVLGTLGAFIFGVSMFIELYRGVVALVGMLFIVAALTIAVKYLLSEFTYEITSADGEWLFVVGQRSGKRYTTLCRVSLASVVSIKKKVREKKEKLDAYDRLQRLNGFRYFKSYQNYQRYVYVPTLMPDTYYEMTVSSRYEKAKVSLQLTDEMAELLLAYAEEARLLSPDEDE